MRVIIFPLVNGDPSNEHNNGILFILVNLIGCLLIYELIRLINSVETSTDCVE